MKIFLERSSNGMEILMPGYPNLSPSPPATNTKAVFSISFIPIFS